MTSTELNAAYALQSRLELAGQMNTPQYQAVRAKIRSADRQKRYELYVPFVVGGGLAGAAIGWWAGAALKGAIIGAVGVPLAITGLVLYGLKGMQ